MLHRTWMVLIHTIPCRSYYAVGHCFPFGLCKLVGPASHVGRSYCYASPQTCRPCFVVERGSVPYGLCDLVRRIHFGRRLPLRLCQLVRRVYIIGPNFVACTSPQAASAVFNWTWFFNELVGPVTSDIVIILHLCNPVALVTSNTVLLCFFVYVPLQSCRPCSVGHGYYFASLQSRRPCYIEHCFVFLYTSVPLQSSRPCSTGRRLFILFFRLCQLVRPCCLTGRST